MIRIVKLHFQEAHLASFLNHFERVKEQVATFPGCAGMQLLQDKKDPCCLFTYSIWENEAALAAYRQSDLFASIWPTIKPWFASAAEAWSTDLHFNGI
ncbi:MAG: hypothetical protein RLZZ301_626 [Bacteroidota bacterium]|jgi:quinol monooxygenase YgiN